jgi:predicted nucleic acid-binding protein
MTKVLIDTNIIISYDRGKEFDFNLLWDLFLFDEVELFTSVVVSYEYLLGISRQIWHRKAVTEKFRFLKVLPINNEIAKKAAGINQIHQIGMGDAMIAATCLVHDLELATHNKKHFQMIEGLKIWESK